MFTGGQFQEMHAYEHKSHPHCLSAWVLSSLSRDLSLMENGPRNGCREQLLVFSIYQKEKRKKIKIPISE